MTLPLTHLGGDGPPLLLIHGFGADRFSWTPMVPGLAGKFALWAVELPGHGKAGRVPEACAPHDLATLVAGSMASLPAPMPVAGHSLGGAVALHLAETHPDLVSQLILIAPAGWGMAMDPDFLRALPALTDADATKELLQRMVARPQLIAPAMVEQVLDALAQDGRRDDLARLAEAILIAETPPGPTVPTTVIWGRDDRINPLDPARQLPGDIDLHIIDNAGHLPHAEAAGKVARLIAQALA